MPWILLAADFICCHALKGSNAQPNRRARNLRRPHLPRRSTLPCTQMSQRGRTLRPWTRLCSWRPLRIECLIHGCAITPGRHRVMCNLLFMPVPRSINSREANTQYTTLSRGPTLGWQHGVVL